MANLLIANAGAWQPTADEFREALNHLHGEDAVRCAIETACASQLHPGALNKARLLARHLLLCELINSRDTQGKYRLRKREVRLPVSAYGKPLTASYGDGNYSVTHVAEWVCCACSSAPLGVDLVAVYPQDEALSSYFLSKEELAQIEVVPRQQWASLFALIWSLKECVLKVIGLGLSKKLKMRDIFLDRVGLENLFVVSNAVPGSLYTVPKHRLMVSLQGNTKHPWVCSSLMLPGTPPHILSVVLQEGVVKGDIEVMFVSPETALHD
ncbi:hypothetical protein LSCM1_06424 [Leishmania martiniquensis]|uniref:holo-[acyl-carrier-protein] synthase n=1 Tax=Leishmania martiniquensis TaxID=1580590 RepID=A0A836KLI8_9TRYP|nr:hypothetical protein LSCM1_06424 [Leishmania martiniquensis]